MIVTAPAKINLTLEVTGVEPNGYHLLDTLFAWLDLEDTLELSAECPTSLTVRGEGVSTELVSEGEDNLVLRALRGMEQASGRSLPTRISLLKRIPAGGGLGGGSADAAATLFALNQLHQVGFSAPRLLELARPLGADVAFGLLGGMARGTRYGDRLEARSFPGELLRREVVLVLPPLVCPTPRVYGLWDSEPSSVARGASERFLASSGHDLYKHILNDLEEPAFRLHPSLRLLKERMVSLGLRGVSLSGSGSSLFGFLPSGMNSGPVREALSVNGVKVLITKLKESTRFGLVS